MSLPTRQCQPNLAGLALLLRVYDLRGANPQLTLWQVGDLLPRFMLGNKIKSTDTHAEIVNKRNVLSASVARYLKKAEIRVENTSNGLFF